MGKGGGLKLAAAIGGGILLGAVCWLGDMPPVPGSWLDMTLTWLGNSAGPWLLLAFALGAWTQTRGLAAVAGAVGLGCAVVTYYGLILLTGSRPDLAPAYIHLLFALWFGAALVVGGGMALLGTLVHAPREWVRIGAAVLLSAAVGSETLLYLAQIASYGDVPRSIMLLIEFAVAFALPWLFLRERRSAFLAASIAFFLSLSGALVVQHLRALLLPLFGLS